MSWSGWLFRLRSPRWRLAAARITIKPRAEQGK